MNRALFAVPLLLLPLAGCAAGGADAEDPPPERPLVVVQTLEVAPRRVVDRALWSADLLPLRRATLAAEVPGVVEELRVEIGDRLAAGALLARIDTRSLEQQVSEAEALFRQAESLYETARALFEKRSITRERLIRATTDRDVAAARLASARLALGKSEIKAPWSGQVAVRAVEVGDYVVPGQPVAELVRVDRLKVVAPAPAADVPFLAPGQPVTVTVDVLPQREFAGRIVRLGAELDRDTRTLEVEAEIDNPAGTLRPGMFGRVAVPRRTLDAALLLPLSAVVDFEKSSVVYLEEDGVARRREVTLGVRIGEEVVIDTGLRPGERVIVNGQLQVSDGQPVQPADGA